MQPVIHNMFGKFSENLLSKKGKKYAILQACQITYTDNKEY